MADRAQISKSVGYVLLGQDEAVKMSKAVAYIWLTPGTDEPDTSNRQGHVYSRIVRR